MMILLSDWAARNYSPPPSDWTLRKMARDGQIVPPPVKRGKHWYVAENARDAAIPAASVADRLARDLAAA